MTDIDSISRCKLKNTYECNHDDVRGIVVRVVSCCKICNVLVTRCKVLTAKMSPSKRLTTNVECGHTELSFTVDHLRIQVRKYA